MIPPAAIFRANILLLPNQRSTNSSFCFSSSACSPFLSLTVGSVLSVPAVGGRYTPATGCAAPGGTRTTWRALRATRARGSCPRERSLAWWRTRSCVGSTTTPWWRTWNERLRAVSGFPCSRRGVCSRGRPYWEFLTISYSSYILDVYVWPASLWFHACHVTKAQ